MDPVLTFYGVGLAAVAGLLKLTQNVTRLSESLGANGRLEALLGPALLALPRSLRSSVSTDTEARRTFELVDLVTTSLIGIVTDRLMSRPEGFSAIDHLDFREWLRNHGADPLTLDSPLVRGTYDLAFSYENGDPDRPRMSAGVGLRLGARMFLTYSGSMFWKMQAGMGEAVFAPLYQALRLRGVDVRFFHRVDALRVAESGESIGAIELGIQADLVDGTSEYQPLECIGGLPCWPTQPMADQLENAGNLAGLDLESYWSPRRDAGRLHLEAGRDFDVIVFGISIGMAPYVCADLIARSPRWSDMVQHLGVVATQAVQLWLRADEQALGWTGPTGVTVSGFAKPFDTWASMGHLVDREGWPDDDRPSTVAYFCSTIQADPLDTVSIDGVAQSDLVRQRAARYMDEQLSALWPAAVSDTGFRGELLCNGQATTPLGPTADQLRTQYFRANVDPSDLYVQALPGTDQYRMAPNESGFRNLMLAGDWTNSGINAGCLEAATRSGLLAARAVEEWTVSWSQSSKATQS